MAIQLILHVSMTDLKNADGKIHVLSGNHLQVYPKREKIEIGSKTAMHPMQHENLPQLHFEATIYFHLKRAEADQL